MINFSIVYNRKHKLTKKGTALIQIKAYLNNKAKFFPPTSTLPPDNGVPDANKFWTIPTPWH